MGRTESQMGRITCIFLQVRLKEIQKGNLNGSWKTKYLASQNKIPTLASPTQFLEPLIIEVPNYVSVMGSPWGSGMGGVSEEIVKKWKMERKCEEEASGSERESYTRDTDKCVEVSREPEPGAVLE